MNWPNDFMDKVICGNCIDVMAEMPDESVDLVVTSPPYNCRKDYGDSFRDEMPWKEYYDWMQKVIKQMYRVLVAGGVVAINVPLFIRWQRDHAYAETWRDYDGSYRGHRGSDKVNGRGRVENIGINLLARMWHYDNHLREPIVWVKGTENEVISTTYQMGSDNNPYMRPCHEHILLGSKRHWHHRGGTGRRGREAVPYEDYTKDVWFIQNNADKEHPATFPVEIPHRLITLFTHADDAVVLDPFMGVGNTGLAAVRLGRHFIGIDIEPKYCEIARQRIAEERQQLKLLRKEQR